MNQIEFMQAFNTQKKCLAYIKKTRYKGWVKCPKCSWDTYELKQYGRYQCKKCRHQTSITAWTIFHNSTTPLPKRFMAIYLMTTSKKWIPALQLKKHIGVTYKTAWRMLHKIRSVMKDWDNLLEGIVEIDETYVGGKKKGKRGRGSAWKTCVVGAVDRDDNTVQCTAISKPNYDNLMRFIVNNIKNGSRIISDEWSWYNDTASMWYEHDTINHSHWPYAIWDIHTDTIEGFRSLFKRWVIGIYHHVSKQHLTNYLNEFTWRYNNRDNPDMLWSLIVNI